MKKNNRIKKLSLKNKLFNQLDEHEFNRGSIERQFIRSKILKHSRTVDVYLPPSYHLNRYKTYPVLYMQDGNNLYYPEIAFGGMPWNMHHMLDRLIAHDLVEEVIVIGIYNSMGRSHEYTWHPMRFSHGIEGGGGQIYANFIVEELKPYLERRYRISKDPAFTAVGGSSLGGIISLYLGLYYPEVFGNIGAISPSLWWAHGRVFEDYQSISTQQKIWVCMGTREGSSKQKVKENPNIYRTRRLKGILEDRGFVEGQNLAYLEDRGAGHNEWSWGQRLHLPLMYFFGKKSALIWTNKS